MFARVGIAALGGLVLAFAAPASASAATKPSCEQILFRLVDGLGAPRQIAGPAPAGLLSQFGALRRPQIAADLLPPFAEVDSALADKFGSYYTDAIRQIAPGRYLVIGHTAVFGLPPARCLPASERRDRAKLLRQEQARAAELTYCVATLTFADCKPLSNLARESDMAQQELEGNDVQELVPDGVARVLLRYRDGQTQTVAVTGNLLRFTVPAGLRRGVRASERKIDVILLTQLEHGGHPFSRRQRLALAADRRQEERAERQLVPAAVVWQSASGAVVATVRPPLIRAPVKLLPNSVLTITVGPTSPSCPNGSSNLAVPSPSAIPGPAPTSLLSQLAVLRQAQSPSDILPAIAGAGLKLSIDLRSYYPDATRQLVPGVYLLVGSTGPIRAPTSCSSSSRRAERPPSARHAQAQAPRPVYCVSTLADANCQPLSNLDSEDDLAIQVAHGGPARELVPDGVASVSATYGDGRSQIITVTNNLVQFDGTPAARNRAETISSTINYLDTVLLNRPSPALAKRDRAALTQALRRYTRTLRQLVPATVVWRSSTGAAVRTLHPPLTGRLDPMTLAAS